MWLRRRYRQIITTGWSALCTALAALLVRCKCTWLLVVDDDRSGRSVGLRPLGLSCLFRESFRAAETPAAGESCPGSKAWPSVTPSSAMPSSAPLTIADMVDQWCVCLGGLLLFVRNYLKAVISKASRRVPRKGRACGQARACLDPRPDEATKSAARQSWLLPCLSPAVAASENSWSVSSILQPHGRARCSFTLSVHQN